jgi:hypothetical protein
MVFIKSMKKITFKLFLIFSMALSCGNSFAADWLYTVRPGDTLWDLCLLYTKEPGCWNKLDKVNNVAYPRRLPPGFVISFPVEWLKVAPTPVEVSYVDGDVSVKLRPDLDAVPLSAGDKLPIGAQIVTREGNINLLFADGTTMQLEPNSELILDTLSAADGVGIVDSRLRLNRGAVKTRVIKREPATRFQITTPAAVAAVRGTEYRVSSSSGDETLMRGEVFEGLVDVSANETQQGVAAGYGIVAKEGEPLSEPKALLPAPVFVLSEVPQSLPVTVSWQPLVGAKIYQLDILQDNNNEELIQRVEHDSVEYSLDSLDFGCYRLRLRGIDNDQLQGLASEQKLCVTPNLAGPTLSKEDLAYKGRFESTLSWLAVIDAKYHYQIASDPSFNTILDQGELTTPQLMLSANEDLYVRVQVIGASGQSSEYSNTLHWQPQSNHWPALIVIGLALVLF